MWLTSRLGLGTTSSQRRRPAVRRPAAQLWLERLEDRTVPAFGFVSAFRFGSITSDCGHNLATDAVGNLYVIGRYSGSADFDPNGTNPGSNHVLTAATSWDTFVAKYGSTGTFQWVTDLGPNLHAKTGIALDGPNAKVYAAWAGAVWNGTTLVNGGDLHVTRLGADSGTKDAGWEDVKLTNSGTSPGTLNVDRFVGIAVGPLGGVYVAGSNFPTGQAVVAKLNASGTSVNDILAWQRVTSGGSAMGAAVAVDGSENVYLTGSYAGAVGFGPGRTLTSIKAQGTSTRDAFVWQLNAAGSTLWAGSLGSSGTDRGDGIAVSSNGTKIDLVGVWGNLPAGKTTIDFDPGASILPLTYQGGASDGFVVHLVATGSGYMAQSPGWAKDIGGSGEDQVNGVGVDGAGNVYISGFISGASAIIVSEFSTSGTGVADATISSGSLDQGVGITVSGSGSIYITGGFAGTADFDPTVGTYNLTALGQDDAFVLKLTQPGSSSAFRRTVVIPTIPVALSARADAEEMLPGTVSSASPFRPDEVVPGTVSSGPETVPDALPRHRSSPRLSEAYFLAIQLDGHRLLMTGLTDDQERTIEGIDGMPGPKPAAASTAPRP